jgi:hypothetical protein
MKPSLWIGRFRYQTLNPKITKLEEEGEEKKRRTQKIIKKRLRGPHGLIQRKSRVNCYNLVYGCKNKVMRKKQ